VAVLCGIGRWQHLSIPRVAMLTDIWDVATRSGGRRVALAIGISEGGNTDRGRKVVMLSGIERWRH